MAKKPAKPKGDERPKGVGVIYARYSSHNQREASIEQQVDQAKEFAARIGLEIVQTYSDKALSGKTDNRPAFQRLLKDAEAGKFQYVVAWKSNRMGRNMMNAMVNEARLQNAGVRVLYTEEDFDDTAAGRFALRSMMNVNQFYIENMAEDIRRGLMGNARKCMWNGIKQFGYRKSADGMYEINPERAEILIEICHRFVSGESLASIAKDLNARGITTERGLKWNKNSFGFLSCERYRGVYLYGDVRIEDGMPRILDDDLFFKVQEELAVRKNRNGVKRKNADFLLTGLLYCGTCGSPMTGLSGTSKTGATHYYYACAGKTNKTSKTVDGPRCTKKNVRRDDIEEYVTNRIMDVVMNDQLLEHLADYTEAYCMSSRKDSEIALLEGELSTVEISIKNLMKAIEAGILTDTTKERLVSLETERANINAKISIAKSEEIKFDRDLVLKGLKSFRSGDITDQKFREKLITTFVQKIILYDDGVVKLIFSFAGDHNTVEGSLDLENSTSPDLGEAGSSSGCYAVLKPASSNHGIQICLIGPWIVLSGVLPD